MNMMDIRFVIVAVTCVVLVNAATLPTTPLSETTEGIEQFKKPNKYCTDHSQCSCTGGIPVCYNNGCTCINTNLICYTHINCGEVCGTGIGICIYNACKCYELIENKRLTDSVQPWAGQMIVNEPGEGLPGQLLRK